MHVSELTDKYHIYGCKGHIWSNNTHIYLKGAGNLCCTPALSANWAQMENIQEIGCEKCIEAYNKLENE